MTEVSVDAAELVAQASAPPVCLADSGTEQPAKAWKPPLAGCAESGLFVARSRNPVEIRLECAASAQP